MADKPESKVVSLSGQPIYLHGEPAPFEPPKGEECIEQISAHIKQHLGEIAWVFHEIVSDTVHIDVFFIKPTEDCPLVRLVTSGMSDLPMSVPDGTDSPKFVELVMLLPPDWKLDQESFKNEGWYWPIRLMKYLARLPHKHSTWLGWGHTIPHGDPAEPYAPNTKLCGAIILPSITVPEDFCTLRINDDKTIHFLAVVPLFLEEMELKLREGANALIDRLGDKDVTDVVDLSRPNTCKKRFGLF